MATAMVTGASSGIGEVLARLFAEGGHDLILVARSEDKLASLARRLERKYKVQVHAEPADLSLRSAGKKLAASLRQQDIDVDVLVNNAGVLEAGLFVDMPVTDHKRLIDLNISGMTSLLNHFLPPMVARGEGRVLNVASIAAFQPVPGLATYAATKAYVLSLTESLAEELSGTGVTITALCPGITATSMVSNAQKKNSGLQKIPAFLIGDVEDVAAQGYRACMRGDVICVPGTLNLATTITGRAMPKWLVRRVSGVIGRYTSRNDA